MQTWRHRWSAAPRPWSVAACALVAILLAVVPDVRAAPTTFSHTGAAQSYVVPSANTVIIEAWGGQGGYDPVWGGPSYGGNGAYVSSIHTVTPGETLQVNVGGQGGLADYVQNGSGYAEGAPGGFNGGGRGGSNPGLSFDIDFWGAPGGGGASDVRRGGTGLAQRIITAGGGGGGAYRGDPRCSYANASRGGAGGAPNGAAGMVAPRVNGGFDAGTGGGGATQSAGGAAASSYWNGSYPATAGSLGQGGNGSSYDINGYNPGQGHGGGGGYYGGGGGGNAYECGNPGGGGGGGSSHSSGSSASMVAGSRMGHGQITITPVMPDVSGLAQFRSDGATSMPSGSTQPTSTVVLAFNVSDPQAGRTITPWIEIRANGAAFSGTCGVGVANTVIAGSPVVASAANTPYAASVTVSGLASGSSYAWRACATDGSGSSPWTPMGGSPDFRVDTVAPTAPAIVSPTASPAVSPSPTLTATYLDPATGSAGTLSFQVCSDSGCASVVRSGTSSAGIAPSANGTWSVSPSLPPGTWYWRAWGTDAAGNVGPASAAQPFQVAPRLTAASPATLVRGRRGQVVRLTGVDFQSGAVVSISGGGLTLSTPTFISSTTFDITIDTAGAATLGARDVTLTNPDGGVATATGLITVVAPSLTLSLSTLGYADLSRTSTGPYGIDLGTATPGAVRAVGPAGSGQATAGPAIRAMLVTDTHTQLLVRATTPTTGGGTTMPVGSLAFKPSASATWVSMANTDQVLDNLRAPGSSTVDADLQLTIPASQEAGSYSSTMVVSLIAQP